MSQLLKKRAPKNNNLNAKISIAMNKLNNYEIYTIHGGKDAPSAGSWTPWGLIYEIGQDLGHHLGHWWYGNEADHIL